MATPIEPQVKLFDGNNGLEYNDDNIINFGEVKAGDKSDVKLLHLWNNKGGASLASKMRDVEMFVLDAGLQRNDIIVTNGWLWAKCNSGETTANTKMDAEAVIHLTAQGQTTGEILGDTNDGADTNTGNFAAFELYAQLEGDDIVNAPHGPRTFFLAVRYFYT